MRKIFLSQGEKHNELIKWYRRAIKNSKELYIASAFLTDWKIKEPLNEKCKKLLFIVGTDFGLTRKSACEDVIKWLPKRFKSDFLAVPSSYNGNFHPKVIVWQEHDNRYYAIIGSSNLSEAAFSSNIEANILLEISKSEYNDLIDWIEKIAVQCQVINEDWLEQYKERNYSRPKGTNPSERIRVINIQIPKGKKYDKQVKERREKQRSFKEIKNKLIQAMEDCERGSISNSEFWEKFWKLWSKHESRIQGEGLQISGKSANWRQACKAMLRIIRSSKNVSEVQLDRIVSEEIDMLARAKNPVRRAWFSEMLCHYFPDRYPLLNGPVEEWLRINHWKAQSGSSEGAAYVELARKLREILRQNKDRIRDLAELDAVIWLSVNS